MTRALPARNQRLRNGQWSEANRDWRGVIQSEGDTERRLFAAASIETEIFDKFFQRPAARIQSRRYIVPYCRGDVKKRLIHPDRIAEYCQAHKGADHVAMIASASVHHRTCNNDVIIFDEAADEYLKGCQKMIEQGPVLLTTGAADALTEHRIYR
jgi:hypothetical protein